MAIKTFLSPLVALLVGVTTPMPLLPGVGETDHLVRVARDGCPIPL